MVVAPRLMKNGPPAIRKPVLEALVEALPRYFAITGGTTMLFGILLVGTMFGWDKFGAVFQGSAGYPAAGGGGAALGLGFLLAILMLFVGFGVIKPTTVKMLKVMQSVQGPPTPEVQARLAALGKRTGIAGMALVLMGTLAIFAMTWAVNTVR
jgi:hypothetical protein